MKAPRLPRKLKKLIKLHAPARLVDNLMLLMYYANKVTIKITSIDKLEWVEEKVIFHKNNADTKPQKLDDKTERWIEENNVAIVRTEPSKRIMQAI